MAIRKAPQSTSWPVAEAKAHFDDVIDEVEVTGPHQMMRNGDALAMIAASDGWDVEPIQDLAAFFASAQLGAGELDITWRPDTIADLRKIDV